VLDAKVILVRFPGGAGFPSLQSRLAVEPTQPPIQWILKIKRPEREAGHLHPESRLRIQEDIPHFPHVFAVRCTGIHSYGDVPRTINL
jgi:hypothetical protein